MWRWRSKQPPKEWRVGDRIFCYESSPTKRVVGLGELVDPYLGIDEEGNKLYRVRFLTLRFAYMPHIDELRLVDGLQNASFLKLGPASTVLSLSEDQAQVLFTVLMKDNPEIRSVWPDLVPSLETVTLPDIDLTASVYGVEGKRYLATHLRIERSQAIVVEKKAKTLATFGKLECEVCSFDFEKIYGTLGKHFCEVHHTKPLSKANASVKTELKDLAIVCSNCHRMLHRMEGDDLSVNRLRKIFLKKTP